MAIIGDIFNAGKAIIGVIRAYWPLLVIMFWLLTFIKRTDKTGMKLLFLDFSHNQVNLMCYIIGLLLVVYFLSRWLFADVKYFLIGTIPIFYIIMWIIFTALDSKHDQAIIECRIQGQKIIEIETNEEFVVKETAINIWRAPQSVYKEIKHSGDARHEFWEFPGLTITDYFDKEKGIMYHPEHSMLKNLSFYGAKLIWLALVDKVPENDREFLKRKVLAKWEAMHNLGELEKQILLNLLELDFQIDEEFQPIPNIRNLLKDVKQESHSEKVNLEKPKDKNKESQGSDENGQITDGG